VNVLIVLRARASKHVFVVKATLTPRALDLPALDPRIEHANGPCPYLKNYFVFSIVHAHDGVEPLDPRCQLQERCKIDGRSARVITAALTIALALRRRRPRARRW
jgi:hypothetical protein